ncbi:type VI secretion system contractile sheath large subunit [Neorhizobium sp. T786]|uniref:type VI secretion system contractile sheath large subunit n=1 Tax=Pseudorhizobium xiangyangii TaxID=2883104 RepID=UPI001CFF65FA|nr:type VI secretion system contractile sheath large subunit [Neorhizobium xiangyangii]MCB5205262.1 type VI secretion system contractile sheath large subunit [Neorhizobium xiangyangii]
MSGTAELKEQSNSGIANDTGQGSLLAQIMEETRLQPGEESYDIALKGVEAFMVDLLRSNRAEEKINKTVVDRMIAELDRKISKQVDEILHHADFQEIESAWRSLKLLVDRTDFRENIKIDVLSISKTELLDDFEQAPEVVQSGLYKHVYAAGYGQFGGDPTGVMVANYNFGPSAPDVKLLQYVGAVGAMAHAPFIGAAAPDMFGVSSYVDLPSVKELASVYEGPRFRKWNSLRESEDARYIGLTGPRFLLRQPYDPLDNPTRSFVYEENVVTDHEHFLWGNTAFVLATRITDSFAKFRWCPNIIGPQSGGAVHDLPVHIHEAMGQLEAKIPTEVLITDRREFEMAEMGFISLTMRKGTDNAAFFSANSIQKPKRFPNTREGKMAETNYKLGTQLPYMFIINRLAHYIKVLQREQIGSWKEREDLERELNVWLKQYVADQENPPSEVRSRRPLRAATIEVSDVEGDPGWYQVALKVRPHFKYMGANFELSLVGKLDKATVTSDVAV